MEITAEMSEYEKQTLLSAEADVLKHRLIAQKYELTDSETGSKEGKGAMSFMIDCFKNAIEYAETVKQTIESEESFDNLDIDTEGGYIIRDNYNKYNTHVSWAYKKLKEFMNTLEEYKEIKKQLN